MLKKYKPICPVVSSRDFQCVQDTSLDDIEDSHDSKQNREPDSQIQSTKQAGKRKSTATKIAEGRDESDSEDHDSEEEEEEEVESKKKKAAWVDEDDGITLEDAMNSRAFKKNRTVKTIDKNLSYSDYLTKKFISRYPRPKWADPKPAEDKSDEDEDDLTKQAGGFVRKSKNKSLGANYLSLSRLTDINKETRGQEGKVVTAVEFHPRLQVALVAGQAGVLSLFQISGGADNPKLAQVKVDGFPIRVAHFCGDTQVLAGSNKSADLFVYDMETGGASKTRVRHQDSIKNFRVAPDCKTFAVCGEAGSIRLYSARSKELVTEFRMNCFASDAAYSPDGTTLYSHGGTGEIYQWDVRSPIPVQTFVDDGCLKGTRLALSPDGKLLAAGSSSGVVNIYDLPVSVPRPAPHKTLLHLTTPITELAFHPSSQLLALASLEASGAAKLYNARSRSVALNFPPAALGARLCRPNSLAFSPRGAYLALSNNDRTAFLFRLRHFENY